MAEPTILDSLKMLSTSLRLPDTFLMDLLFEKSDWAFVVKAHALLETATTTLLVVHLGKPELEDVISEDLEMEQRIKMLSALELCSPEQRGMMRKLGKLRNKRVHTAHGILFTFDEHLKVRAAREDFWKTFGIGWSAADGQTKPETFQRHVPDLVPLGTPRLAIWWDVIGVVRQTFTASERARIAAIQAQIDQDALLSLMRGPAVPPTEAD